ncbi:MAG: RNA polymerase subunit sigma-70 [Solirubrobacterales bacterium]|nr:RNA polymerase subunit sigma-70 [Solirubrobacterales bacterium]
MHQPREWTLSIEAALVARARSGDPDAFRDLVEPFEHELLVHCYRMLGSLDDAEDALQDILLAAWRGIVAFHGRASVRTWLYRVATNRCLNALRSMNRRPPLHAPPAGLHPPAPSGASEIAWLEPFPDVLLEGLPAEPGPEARLEQSEAIRLTFITVMQLLPPRQRAVLILCDVLGFSAGEVVEMLSMTPDSVSSALKRARSKLRQRADDLERPPAPGSERERHVVARLAHAYETGDVDALVGVLADDVLVSMPPLPLEYKGRDLVAEFHARVTFREGRTYSIVPTRANGEPAFGAYIRHRAGGPRHALGLLAITVAGDRVSGITRFDTRVLARFGLSRALPPEQ